MDPAIPVVYFLPGGDLTIVHRAPCPFRWRWPYRTIRDAQRAWIDGSIKVPAFRRFRFEGSDLLMRWNTHNEKRDPAHVGNPYLTYNGILLGVDVRRGQVVLVMGFEVSRGRHPTGDRFTLAFRVGSGPEGMAELSRGERGLQAPYPGLHATTAQDVHDRLVGRGGMPMYVLVTNFRPVGYPADMVAAVRAGRNNARRMFRAVWDASYRGTTPRRGQVYGLNTHVRSLRPTRLPVVFWLYAKDTV